MTLYVMSCFLFVFLPSSYEKMIDHYENNRAIKITCILQLVDYKSKSMHNNYDYTVLCTLYYHNTIQLSSIVANNRSIIMQKLSTLLVAIDKETLQDLI